MGLLFAFNSLAGCFRNLPGVVDGDTTAGRFNSAFVPDCINLTSTTDNAIMTPPFIGGVGSVTDFWMSWDNYMAGNLFGTGYSWLVFYNSAGVAVASLLGNNSGYSVTFQYWNGSAFVATTAFVPPQLTLARFTVHLVAGVSGSFTLYVGEMPVFSHSGLNAAVTNVASVRVMRCGNTSMFVSNFVGADYDTRDSRIIPKKASGNGTYTAGSGSYTDVDEAVLNDSDAVGLSTGNKKTFVHTGITVPSGLRIAEAVVNARIRETSPVTTSKAMIRSGSTDSSSADLVAAGAYEPRGAKFSTDPNTAAAWTEAGFDAAEFGLEAA